MKPSPDAAVAAWCQIQNRQSLFLSVVSIGEMHKGFVIMPVGARRTQLIRSIDMLVPAWFQGRILPLTQGIAVRWRVLEGQRQMAGRPLSTPDGQIAATALEHDLTVVTRNVKDFAGLGVTLLNPWIIA